MIMIEVKLTTVIYIVIAIFMLYKVFKEEDSGGFLSGLSNAFWFVLFIVFTLIYGGIFWW